MGKPETRRLAGREIAPVSDTAALPLPLVWDTTRNPLSWPFRAFPCLLPFGMGRARFGARRLIKRP